MKRFVGLTFVMFLAVAFGSSVVEAGCKHRRHCGHGCHASSCCEAAVCEPAPVVEECVVEECAPSHCCHRRHHCGLFGHRHHCHRHHCHSGCETVVESSSGCASGGCHGGEVVTSGAAPASAEVIKEGKPTPAAPAAPKAPATSGT